jgi:hypothetical protein
MNRQRAPLRELPSRFVSRGTASTASRAGNPPTDTRGDRAGDTSVVTDRIATMRFSRRSGPANTVPPGPEPMPDPRPGPLPPNPVPPNPVPPNPVPPNPVPPNPVPPGPGPVPGPPVPPPEPEPQPLPQPSPQPFPQLLSRCRPGRLAGPLSDPVGRAGTTNRVQVCPPRRAGSSAWAPARPGTAAGSGAGARRRHRVVGVPR